MRAGPGCASGLSARWAWVQAVHSSRIRSSLSLPIRSTSTATDTLSTESRFTAQSRGIGSSAGSRTTSLGIPRIVVVHGATRQRRNRGMAASRDSTTTGRRPISGRSDHQTSPRLGNWIMSRRRPHGTRSGRPTRRAHRADARRRPSSLRRPRLACFGRTRSQAPCLLEELAVDRCADPNPRHGISMPWACHFETGARVRSPLARWLRIGLVRSSQPAASSGRARVSTDGERRPDSYAEIAGWLVAARAASSA